jgi:hypothetical protein
MSIEEAMVKEYEEGPAQSRTERAKERDALKIS